MGHHLIAAFILQDYFIQFNYWIQLNQKVHIYSSRFNWGVLWGLWRVWKHVVNWWGGCPQASIWMDLSLGEVEETVSPFRGRERACISHDPAPWITNAPTETVWSKKMKEYFFYRLFETGHSSPNLYLGEEVWLTVDEIHTLPISPQLNAALAHWGIQRLASPKICGAWPLWECCTTRVFGKHS